MPSTGYHRRCVHADDAWRPSGLCESEERADFGVVCEDLLRWLELTERLARDAAQTRDRDSSSAGNSGYRDLRALYLQCLEPFGARGGEGPHLTVCCARAS